MGKYANIFKESAAGGAGFLTAFSGALLLGMALGIPGLILVTRENKKPKSKRNILPPSKEVLDILTSSKRAARK